MVDIGTVLKRARIKKGLSVYRLAKMTKVSEKTIRRFEKGETKGPRADKLRALKEVLGIRYLGI